MSENGDGKNKGMGILHEDSLQSAVARRRKQQVLTAAQRLTRRDSMDRRLLNLIRDSAPHSNFYK